MKNYTTTTWMFVCSLVLITTDSYSAGVLSYEGWGFLKSADDRSNSAQTFVGGPDIEGRGRLVEGKTDLRAYAFMASETAFTGEAKNLYIASSQNLSNLHQGTFGRRAYDWSVMDETWKMGTWSPRFLWDPLRPETVGLTGGFYTYQSKNWRALAFASPISIPERGFPTSDNGGRITSASPYFVNLPQYVRMSNGKRVPMNYTLNMPPMGDVLFRPAAAISGRYMPEKGLWVGLNYGFMPIHQPDLGVNAPLQLSSKTVEVEINPRLPMHHMLTAESGYRGDFWQLWGSITGEKPEAPDNTGVRYYTPMGPSMISSWGGKLFWQQGLSLHTSYLTISEDKPVGPESEIDLGSRYAYTKAWVFGGTWQPTSLLTYAADWTYDVEKVSSLFSTDITFRKPIDAMSSWAIGVGADLINTSSGEGWIGRFEGNDRFRGKISYAF